MSSRASENSEEVVMDAKMQKRIKHRDDMFLGRLFAMLAKMAKADGRVSAWEVHAAEGAFSRFQQASARRAYCVEAFNAARNSSLNLCQLAKDFASRWALPSECLAVYELLWDIACSTGVLEWKHKEKLRQVCACLGLPPAYFEIFYRRRKDSIREDAKGSASAGRRKSTSQKKGGRDNGHSNQGARGGGSGQREDTKTKLDRAYEMLGCRVEDSDDVLRHLYHVAAKKNHPDLLRAQGGSEADIRHATALMAKINEAWEEVRKARGI